MQRAGARGVQRRPRPPARPPASVDQVAEHQQQLGVATQATLRQVRRPHRRADSPVSPAASIVLRVEDAAAGPLYQPHRTARLLQGPHRRRFGQAGKETRQIGGHVPLQIVHAASPRNLRTHVTEACQSGGASFARSRVRRNGWRQSSQSYCVYNLSADKSKYRENNALIEAAMGSDNYRLLQRAYRRVQESGIKVEQPDLCVLKPAGVSFVEVKRDPDRIRPPQQVFALLSSVLLGIPLTLCRVVPVGKTVDPVPIIYRSRLSVLSELLDPAPSLFKDFDRTNGNVAAFAASDLARTITPSARNITCGTIVD